MVKLSKRSSQKELLDAEGIPFDDIKICLQELNSINSLLGGHRITLQGVDALYDGGTDFHIAEIGCGGGDNLYAIEKDCKKGQGKISYSGVDLKNECIDFAAARHHALKCNWIASDYREVRFPQKPDLIFSSLFCHHFSEAQLVIMLQWMKENCSRGFFINDLQRNVVAYYLIKWLTALFSKSYLVKNDACISVARGFRKKDWQRIFSAAGLSGYSIRWKWAFRYLIVYQKT